MSLRFTSARVSGARVSGARVSGARVLGALALVFLVPAAAQAQGAFKVGYIDADQVVVRTPEYAQGQQQLAREQQSVGTRVRFLQDSLNTVLQTKLADYETFRNSAVATADARRTRETELLQLQGAIEQAEQQGLQFLAYREAQLAQPALNRVDGAIRAEAAAQSIDLVMPNTANNAPVVLYASERVIDITEAVARRLGVDLTVPPPGQPSAPGATGAAPTPPSGN